MPCRQEILDDGTVELMSVVDGKTYFMRYRSIGEALSRSKEILTEEQRIAKSEFSYQRKESKGLYSSPRFVEDK